MKELTLIAVDFLYHDLTKFMVERAANLINPKEIVIVSDKNFLPGSTFVCTKPIRTMRQYSQYLLKNMWPLIDTTHCIYMQWDSMIMDNSMWTDEFLNYDYIGAPWPWHSPPTNIGNGGFSLRSKKLLDALCDGHIVFRDEEDIAEDMIIGNVYRWYLESAHKIKFPPFELAKQFSFEGGTPRKSWGYHGIWNVFRYADNNTIEYFLPRIDYERWNIHHCLNSIRELLHRGNLDYLRTVIEQIKINKSDLIPQIRLSLQQNNAILQLLQ